MKYQTLFQEETITKLRKYIDTFKKSSSLEPLGQIQPKLGTMHSWVKTIEVCSNEGYALFQGDIIMNSKKTLTNFKKSSSPEPMSQPFSTKLGTKHPWVNIDSIFSSEGPRSFPRGDNYEIAKIH